MHLTDIHAAEWGAVLNTNHSSSFFTNPGEDVTSVHGEKFDQVGWTGIGLERLLISTSNANSGNTSRSELVTVVYTASVGGAFLASTHMVLPVPGMELKESNKRDYRFKLVGDFGYKVATKAVFGSDKTDIQTLDTHSQIILREKMTANADVKAMEKRMGLRTVCNKWVTKLEPIILYYRQQFYYSLWPSKAFPAYLVTSTSSLVHRYILSLNILRHINIEKFDRVECKWKPVKFIDPSLFVSIPTLPIPDLYARYTSISPPEVESRELAKLNTFYILDMICCDAANKHKPGSDAIATLKPFSGLVQVLFWALENVTHEDINIRCNYTIEASEDSNSRSPIATNSLATAHGPKFEDIEPILLEEIAQGVLPNSGTKNGIVVWPYVERVGPCNNGGTPAQNMGTTISCKILDETSNKGQKYILICRALTCRKMIIEGGKVRMD